MVKIKRIGDSKGEGGGHSKERGSITPWEHSSYL